MALRLQYPAKVQPLLEPNSELSWYKQPSEPDSFIQVQYTGLAGPVWIDLPPLTWFQPASEPVRSKPTWLAPGRANPLGTFFVRPLVEPPSEISWWRPTNEPRWSEQTHRPRSQPLEYHWTAPLVEPSDIAPNMGWWRPANEPRWSEQTHKPRNEQLGYTWTAPLEDQLFSESTGFGWWVQNQEPVRLPAKPVQEGDWGKLVEHELAMAALSIGWWMPAQEPLRTWPKRSKPLGHTFYVSSFVEPPEIAAEITWWRQTQEPVQTWPKRSEPLGYQWTYPLNYLVFAETTIIDWYRPANEPVRVPPRPVDVGWHTTNLEESLLQEEPMAWWMPASEPVRVPGQLVRVGWFDIPLDALPPDMVTWFVRTEEPVRVRATFASYMTAGWTGEIIFTIPPLDGPMLSGGLMEWF